MDDVHGFVPDTQVEKFKEDLAAHIWFRDGGIHREGAQYDHLKRFRKRLNGVLTLDTETGTAHQSCDFLTPLLVILW